MKIEYKGHEIEVSRERCNGGWSMLYYSIFRIADKYECASGCTEDASTVQEYITQLKSRVDAELASSDPWDEKQGTNHIG